MNELNAVRKEKGLSVNAFAEALGLSISYATKLLYNDRPVTLSVIRRVLAAFPDTDVKRFI